MNDSDIQLALEAVFLQWPRVYILRLQLRYKQAFAKIVRIEENS